MHAYDFIALPVRTKKPREQGLTSVLDKGMGVMQLQDFLADAAPYVDIVKFGWGTSRLFPAERLRAKIGILHDNEIYVCPGGTLLEVAVAQNCATEFFKEIKQLGFSCVEISDGTVAMTQDAKLGLIREARQHQLCVLSEIGKKSPREDSELSVDERIAQARAELDAGAWKIIIEGRETGTVGVFDAEGDVQSQEVDQIVDAIGLQTLIFEAPQKNSRRGSSSTTATTSTSATSPPPKSSPSKRCAAACAPIP